MEPDFWGQVGAEKNVALGAAISFAVIFLLANLDWRRVIRAWVGQEPYPNPTRIKFARFFLGACFVSTICNLGTELAHIPSAHPNIGASLAIAATIIAATMVLYGVGRLFGGMNRLTDSEISRILPAEYALRIVDDVIYNDRTDGETECVPINDIDRITAEKRSSGRVHYRIWFVLKGKQGHRVSFPQAALGKDVVLSRLQMLPGFVLPNPMAVEGEFQCWAA